MELASLVTRIDSGEADLKEILAYIDAAYDFTPTAFQNGDTRNGAGENNGSCKLFSFARLQLWTKERTLAAFGHFYFDHVLKHPEGVDHANIRNFMKYGWDGIRFDGDALKAR